MARDDAAEPERHVLQSRLHGVLQAPWFVKASSKAALLSAFVFPGIGHFYLKRCLIGTLLSGGSAYALYFIVSGAVSKALEIAEKIQTEALPPDVGVIAALVSEKSLGADSPGLSIATTALIGFWVIGIVDSYRLGRAVEKVGAMPIEEKK